MTNRSTEMDTVVKRILPYLRRRLYNPETDIDYEVSFSNSVQYSKGYVDLVFIGGNRKPTFLLEAKRSSKRLTNKDRDQALTYGRHMGVTFVVVTNGSDIRSYNVETSQPIRWDGRLQAKMPSKNQLPIVLTTLKANPRATDILLSHDNSLPFKPGLPLKQLNNLFLRCHRIIRSIEKDEESGFADLSRILFLKLLEEKQDNTDRFRLPYSYLFHELAAKPDSEADQVKDSIKQMLQKVQDTEYGDVLVGHAQLKNAQTFHKLVREMAGVSFSDSNLDTKGAAFEYFVRATLKGKRLGQYFTPRPLVELMVTLIGRSAILTGLLAGNDIRVIDPACGTGGFLLYAMKESLDELEGKLMDRSVANATYERCAKTLKRQTFYGSDASEGVAATAKMNMVIAGDGHSNIRAEDTLRAEASIWDWNAPTADYILTNPPFGTSESDSLSPSDLEQYPVPYPPKGQNLFLQRMILATKPGGLICSVIDEGLLNTDISADLRRWVLEHVDILGLIRLPLETFKPNKINVRSNVLLMRRLEHRDVDLDRSCIITFVKLDSLGYTGAGELVRNFNFMRLRNDFETTVLQSGDSPRTGYSWLAFDLSLEEWSQDKHWRLDFKYWDPDVKTAVDDMKNTGRRLKELNTIGTSRGKSPRAELYVDRGDGHAAVVKAGSCITKYGELTIDSADYIEKNIYDEFPEGVKLQPGDVLIASTGDGTIGKACVFDMEGVPAIADGHVTIVRPDPTAIDSYFLADYLRVGEGRIQIERLYTGSTGLTELPVKHVDNIVVPTGLTLEAQRALSEQLRFAESNFRKTTEDADRELNAAEQAFRCGWHSK